MRKLNQNKSKIGYLDTRHTGRKTLESTANPL